MACMGTTCAYTVQGSMVSNGNNGTIDKITNGIIGRIPKVANISAIGIFWAGVTTRQDYFTHFEQSQSLGVRKREIAERK